MGRRSPRAPSHTTETDSGTNGLRPGNTTLPYPQSTSTPAVKNSRGKPPRPPYTSCGAPGYFFPTRRKRRIVPKPPGKPAQRDETDHAWRNRRTAHGAPAAKEASAEYSRKWNALKNRTATAGKINRNIQPGKPPVQRRSHARPGKIPVPVFVPFHGQRNGAKNETARHGARRNRRNTGKRTAADFLAAERATSGRLAIARKGFMTTITPAKLTKIMDDRQAMLKAGITGKRRRKRLQSATQPL